MKKKSQFQQTRSSYFIKPIGKVINTPEQKPTQLPSPFPPHVHKYLFSGRKITLCDQSGIRISKLAESCESTKRHIDTILAKLNNKPVPDLVENKRQSIPSQLDDPDHPYHLNDRICSVLKEFVEKQVERKILENSESEESLEFEAPPKPSPLLKKFLMEEVRKEHHTPPKKTFKSRIASPIQHFSQPRRGSHPGIVGSITPSSSILHIPSGVSSPVVRSSGQSPASKDVTVWNTTRRLFAVRSNNVSPEPPISIPGSTRRERYKRKCRDSGKKRLASLFETRH